MKLKWNCNWICIWIPEKFWERMLISVSTGTGYLRNEIFADVVSFEYLMRLWSIIKIVLTVLVKCDHLQWGFTAEAIHEVHLAFFLIMILLALLFLISESTPCVVSSIVVALYGLLGKAFSQGWKHLAAPSTSQSHTSLVKTVGEMVGKWWNWQFVRHSYSGKKDRSLMLLPPALGYKMSFFALLFCSRGDGVRYPSRLQPSINYNTMGTTPRSEQKFVCFYLFFSLIFILNFHLKSLSFFF